MSGLKGERQKKMARRDNEGGREGWRGKRWPHREDEKVERGRGREERKAGEDGKLMGLHKPCTLGCQVTVGLETYKLGCAAL